MMLRRTAAVLAWTGLLLGGTQAYASTSHAGWPTIDGRRIIERGPAGEHHTLVGLPDKHNELLGGYGDDTIYGGNAGDVLWADFRPGGTPSQTTTIYGGNGRNFIYASHAANFIYTGTNPATVVHAHFGHGEIHCGSSRIVVYLSHADRKHYKLFGCKRISYASVGY